MEKLLSNWYTLQVRTRHEDEMIGLCKPLVREELGEEVFTMRRKKELHGADGMRETVSVPMFPGYIFIRTDDIERIRQSLRVIIQFKRILKSGGQFMPVYEEEARTFRALGGDAHEVDISIGFKDGDEVGILDGSLLLYTGKIEKIVRHKKTAYIRAMFLGEERVIPVGLEVLSTRQEAEDLRAKMRRKKLLPETPEGEDPFADVG